ncbi:hypothetical protein CEXT_30281 [Caerostris extrusa]|uniref:Uncharacterized protein n=1 Tax=Caerostris extrusa TaxID=172846 RepID=A0AAV4T5X5_CAEEX|nr:hypothetical protein CEXT_30281 [Caerostris extrusa]
MSAKSATLLQNSFAIHDKKKKLAVLIHIQQSSDSNTKGELTLTKLSPSKPHSPHPKAPSTIIQLWNEACQLE